MADVGGSVVAVQLDKEIGLLSSVSNSPVLSDLAGFEFLANRSPIAGPLPTASDP